MARRIGVFTSSRADAGPLGPVISGIERSTSLEPVIVATGTHLDERRGRTLGELALAEGTELHVLDVVAEQSGPGALGRALGAMTGRLSELLECEQLDVLLVLGDRWELLGACSAALLHQVAVAHLHGGEITEGAIDDRIRHAVTKLADLHFCATEQARDQILALGEEPWRVHRVGAPALDRFAGVEPEDLEDATRPFGLPARRPLGLVTYHPPTVERACVAERARDLLDSAAVRLGAGIITAPGADPGSDQVLEVIDEIVARYDNMAFVANLGTAYPALMATADVMIGNSSSGILEASSFRLPVVNVGDRQEGRLAPANVVTCREDRSSIDTAIERALTPGFRDALSGLTNPYGDGLAAKRIVDVLESVDLRRLPRKRRSRQGLAEGARSGDARYPTHSPEVGR